MKKIAIVGAGITGLTIAYLVSRATNCIIDIFEERSFLGGNCADTVDPVTKVITPIYGAHIFHTQNKIAWDFMNMWSEFNDYRHKVKVAHGLGRYDWPINLNTLRDIFGIENEEDAKKFYEIIGKPWELRSEENFETKMLSQVGERLYRMFIYGYTKKMWGVEPRSLEAKHAGRIPVRSNADDSFFSDPYQGMPSKGYNLLFSNMFSACRNTNLIPEKAQNSIEGKYDHVFVTAPIDEWMDYKYGSLQYRGMTFEYEHAETRGNLYLQAAGTINTANSPKVLRVEEPSQYYQQNLPHTILVSNFPSYHERYYPFPSKENSICAEKYREFARKKDNVTFCGRLGLYRYVNMDQAVLMAMKAAEKFTGADSEQFITKNV